MAKTKKKNQSKIKKSKVVKKEKPSKLKGLMDKFGKNIKKSNLLIVVLIIIIFLMFLYILYNDKLEAINLLT